MKNRDRHYLLFNKVCKKISSVCPYFLCLFLLFPAFLCAQGQGLESAADYKINKMKKALQLTESQQVAIRPILKDYMAKRAAFLKETAGQGIVDHRSVKATLKELKDTEYQKLGEILSKDQLQKWIDKENVTAALNPDGGEIIAEDEGATLTPEGANFKF
jgi:hypothetical protein